MREFAGDTILNAQDLSRVSVVTDGKAVQRYVLYSLLDIPAGGGSITQLPFFATPVGGTQTVGGTANNMTLERTNIKKANAITTPNSFILKNIRLCVMNDHGTFACALTDITDTLLVLGTGYFKLTFGEREHLTVAPPLGISSGFGLQGFGGNGSSAGIYGTNQHPLIFKIEPWLYIPSEVNFSPTLEYYTTPAVTSKTRVGVWLDGALVRGVS